MLEITTSQRIIFLHMSCSKAGDILNSVWYAIYAKILDNTCSRQFSEAVAEAGDIVVVGGGPVGVEMAGEIRDKHGDKTITVVSSSDKLVSKEFDEKFQTSLKAVMDRRKVTVLKHV